MESGFITRSIVADGEERRYQVYIPNDYNADRSWPVILFLHGAGEGGRDALLPTEYQLGSAIRRNAAKYPGLVVFPQVPSYQPVWLTHDVDFALLVLRQVQQDFAVDRDRVYVTGVSTGAKAAWHALYRNPELFAAGLIVAGVVRPKLADGSLRNDPDPVVPDADGDPALALARVLRNTPIWNFHGDDDPVFPIEDAREVMAALSQAGAPVRFTELEGFGHDVWDIAYYSEDVADWLFAQTRQGHRE